MRFLNTAIALSTSVLFVTLTACSQIRQDIAAATSTPFSTRLSVSVSDKLVASGFSTTQASSIVSGGTTNLDSQTNASAIRALEASDDADAGAAFTEGCMNQIGDMEGLDEYGSGENSGTTLRVLAAQSVYDGVLEAISQELAARVAVGDTPSADEIKQMLTKAVEAAVAAMDEAGIEASEMSSLMEHFQGSAVDAGFDGTDVASSSMSALNDAGVAGAGYAISVEATLNGAVDPIIENGGSADDVLWALVDAGYGIASAAQDIGVTNSTQNLSNYLKLIGKTAYKVVEKHDLSDQIDYATIAGDLATYFQVALGNAGVNQEILSVSLDNFRNYVDPTEAIGPIDPQNAGVDSLAAANYGLWTYQGNAVPVNECSPASISIFDSNGWNTYLSVDQDKTVHVAGTEGKLKVFSSYDDCVAAIDSGAGGASIDFTIFAGWGYSDTFYILSSGSGSITVSGNSLSDTADIQAYNSETGEEVQ